MIKLEEGKTYVTRDGRVVGPMGLYYGDTMWHDPTNSFGDDDAWWEPEGYRGGHKIGGESDLVMEYNPKMTVCLKLKDMPEVEQLKLRVAFLEGKPVRYYEEAWPYNGWTKWSGEKLDDNLCYRLHEDNKSYLPLEVGKTYKTSKGNFECIYVEDGIAWMRARKFNTAYTWEASTGKAKCLGVSGSYDVIGVAV